MADAFEKIQQNAHIDNYLAGTVKTVERAASATEADDERPVVRPAAKSAAKAGAKRK